MVTSDLSSLLEYASKFYGTRIVCLGDVMLDRFIYGKVNRISPEAPIPVCRVEDETAMLGGAGNVARNLSALGASVEFISVVGDDPVGDNVKSLLQSYSDMQSDIVTVPERITTSKTRYVAEGQQLMRADREITTEISDEIIDNLCSSVERALQENDVLIISDYGKGVVTDRLVSQVISLSKAAHRPVIVDPKSRILERYSGATIITPNLKEFGEAVGATVFSDKEIASSARELLESVQIQSILVTRGARGMSLILMEQDHHFASRAREVFDVSGAGDTVVAALAVGIAAGAPIVSATQLANMAAGIVVGKTGTAVVGIEDLIAEITDVSGLGWLGAATDESSALSVIQKWQKHGKKVGFTNGCFDLLHPGHISLLSQARANCDRLVVGLNSDGSVKRLKGYDRPMQDENARASILSCLETVDLVLIFNEDTPLRLIERIKPDVLVKGADYTVEKVVGADLVRSYGGEVLLAEIVPGFSTTDMISRINSS
ncbi:MAG: D-glycero-beta-D-manno-heptose-7-phosphate kinase [Pseudomonadota bacterium]|nr:D-glycero-beta-D-manno-heptose-7-phosphate kinase [Pseudomonadota bacterium]